MFIGQTQHSVDLKNRIKIPAKYRELLGEKFVMTNGLDKSIFVFTIDEWEKLEKKINSLSLTDKNVRYFKRYFFSGASILSMDSQFRVILPSNLIEFASIDKEVVSVGSGNYLEIWGKENWDSYNEENIDFSNIAESLSELGL